MSGHDVQTITKGVSLLDILVSIVSVDRRYAASLRWRWGGGGEREEVRFGEYMQVVASQSELTRMFQTSAINTLCRYSNRINNLTTPAIYLI